MKVLSLIISIILSSAPASIAGNSKSVKINDASYSKIYPAVWFHPSKGKVHQVVTKSERPPVEGAIVWIEPRDPEFRLAPGAEDASLSVIGHGDAVFKAADAKQPKDKQTTAKLDSKLLLSAKKPVIRIRVGNSISILIIDRIDTKKRTMKFRWRLAGKTKP